MASIGFPQLAKKFMTSDGTFYGYVYAKAKDSKPTFLLIHGYPSTSYEWRHQIEHLSKAGFGVLAPDCLGYGDTDKPTDLEAYRMKRLSSHFVEIMDHEGLNEVIGVGHDWGSSLLSRTVFYNPSRFSKLVWLAVGYLPPGLPFAIDTINAATLKSLGYPCFGYWYFFNSPDAAKIIANNLESFFHLMYPTDANTWQTDFCPLDATRSWITSGRTTPLPSWISSEEKQTYLKILSHGQTAPLNYYRALMRGIQQVDEDVVQEADQKLKVPVMFVGCTEDAVCLSQMQHETTKAYAPPGTGYRHEDVKAGHWPMLEARDRINELLESFASGDN